MRAVERQLTSLARSRDDVTLLRTIPGVGLLTATALVALVGDIRRFPSGREFASFLGLTPKEDSSALRRRLGAISKQGDVYLRMLLIHGARSVLLARQGAGTPTAFQIWARTTQQRRGSQCRGRRGGEQAGPDRLGRLDAPAPICRRLSLSPSRRTADHRVAPQEDCTERTERWRTGRTGAGKCR